jgi:hypothetical protein
MKKIRKSILTSIKFIPKLMPDVLAVSGAIIFSYGAFLIYKPLGYIVLGCMFIASAVILSKSE